MGYIRPTPDQFKAFFVRDFPYSENDEGLEFVNVADIQKALVKTFYMFNEGFAQDQEQYDLMFLTLTAHNLVMSLRTSSQGVASQDSWLHSGKAAGPVSESFAIPDRILANPELALLSRTGYGMEYLEMILPLLVGQMFWVPGRTLP